MTTVIVDINGKRLSAENLSNVLERAFFGTIQGQIDNSLEDLCCGEHQQFPVVRVSGSSLRDLSFEVFGCCDALVKEATQRLQ